MWRPPQLGQGKNKRQAGQTEVFGCDARKTPHICAALTNHPHHPHHHWLYDKVTPHNVTNDPLASKCSRWLRFPC